MICIKVLSIQQTETITFALLSTIENNRRIALVLSIGDVMLDIYIDEPSELNRDTDTPGRTTLNWGGSAANFAVWASRLGLVSAISGRVGADFAGDAAIADFAEEKVLTLLARDPVLPTGTVVVRSRRGSGREMICDRKANATFSVSDLPLDEIKSAKWVHISGYTAIESAPRAAVKAAIAAASEGGAMISVDPGSCSLIGSLGVERFLDAVRGAHLIMPNLEEAELLTKEEDVWKMLDLLLESFPGAVIKLGADGAAYADRQGERGSRAALPAVAVDVNGAGDSFAAAFVAEYLAGGDIGLATEAGCALAACVVGVSGARPAVELDSWKSRYGKGGRS